MIDPTTFIDVSTLLPSGGNALRMTAISTLDNVEVIDIVAVNSDRIVRCIQDPHSTNLMFLCRLRPYRGKSFYIITDSEKYWSARRYRDLTESAKAQYQGSEYKYVIRSIPENTTLTTVDQILIKESIRFKLHRETRC